jgi:hypothetical protein
VLAAELGELASLLPECDLDIAITGFAPAEIDAFMGEPRRSRAGSARWRARDCKRRGQSVTAIYGSSAAIACSAVMPGTRQICAGSWGVRAPPWFFTDPPYNVRIASVQGRGKIRHREFMVASGELSRTEFIQFLIDVAEVGGRNTPLMVRSTSCSWIGATLVKFFQPARKFTQSTRTLSSGSKQPPAKGHFTRPSMSFIFVFKNGDAPHVNNFELGQHGRTRSNVWTYPGVNTFRTGRLDELALHPTVKPVALVARRDARLLAPWRYRA